MTTTYIHGYTSKEQKRLVSQSQFLEPWVYNHLDLEGCANLLEIGSGVGAQTQILSRRLPHCTIFCIDHQPTQLAAAEHLLKLEIQKKQVHLILSPAETTPFPDDHFDGVFICWLLEHVACPTAVLKEAFRVLKPGGRIIVTEVVNSSLLTFPRLPYLHHYFEQLGELQKAGGGHPECGLFIADALASLDFRVTAIRPLPIQLDGRTKDPAQRQQFVTYWQELLQSMEELLLGEGRVTPWMVASMKTELKSLVAISPYGFAANTFVMSPMQVEAKKPGKLT